MATDLFGCPARTFLTSEKHRKKETSKSHTISNLIINHENEKKKRKKRSKIPTIDRTNNNCRISYLKLEFSKQIKFFVSPASSFIGKMSE